MKDDEVMREVGEFAPAQTGGYAPERLHKHLNEASSREISVSSCSSLSSLSHIPLL